MYNSFDVGHTAEWKAQSCNLLNYIWYSDSALFHCLNPFINSLQHTFKKY